MELLHSPFGSQLGTNYVPSDPDVTQIRQLLTRPKARVDEVDKEIKRITDLLENLQRERQVYSTYINQHEAILSPIRRIPTEILQCIFLRCLPTKHNAVMSSLQAPVLLTHVCRDWRAAALKMPRLWASLHIPIPHRPQKPFAYPSYPTPALPQLTEEEFQAYTQSVQRWEYKMQERRQIVKTWFTRAAGCKLSISITLWEGRRSSAEAEAVHTTIKSIMDIVVSYSHQWKRIEVLASHPHICDLLALPMHTVPYLEHMKVTCNPFSTSPIASGPALYRQVSPTGLLAAPSLTSFHCKLLPESPLSLPVNWAQLRELYFDGAASRSFDGTTLEFTPSDAVKLLRSCPLLVRCRMVVVQNSLFSPPVAPSAFNFSSEDEEHAAPITLPHLEYLSIHEGAPLQDFFSQLEAPILNDIVFTSSIPPYDSDSTSLVTLLKNCGPTVQKLTFDFPCLTVEDIQQCLSLVPKLTHLSLSSNPRERSFVVHQYDPQRISSSARLNNALLARVTPGLIDDGTGRKSVVTLCPKLASLSCKFLSPEFSEDALVDFIRSRRSEAMYRHGIAPLQKVHLCFKRPKQDVDVMKELEKENVDVHGLRVAVTYAHPLHKGVESFSPLLGLAPDALLPYPC
ncbi:hypothetical protein H1R20_g2908, partial [Candolleomyces eurysporus]